MESGAHRWYVDTTIDDLHSDQRLFLWLIPVPLCLGAVLLVLVGTIKTDPSNPVITNVANIGGTIVMTCTFWPFNMWRKCGNELRKWRAQSMLLKDYCEGEKADPVKCADQRKKIEDLSSPSGEGV